MVIAQSLAYVISKANAARTRVRTFPRAYRISSYKVYVLPLASRLFLFFSSCSFPHGSQSRLGLSFFFLQSLVSAARLLHHHAAAELLLLRGQTQLLHVGVCAGGRVQAPHGWFGNGWEGALRGRVGLLLQAGMRVCLLADVQTSLEKVSSGGHGGQRGGVAG